jgi:hypothetical protein
VFGWVFAGHQLGAALAAYGAGLMRTVLGTYLPAFFSSGVLCLIAALLIITVRKNPQPAERRCVATPSQTALARRVLPRASGSEVT